MENKGGGRHGRTSQPLLPHIHIASTPQVSFMPVNASRAKMLSHAQQCQHTPRSIFLMERSILLLLRPPQTSYTTCVFAGLLHPRTARLLHPQFQIWMERSILLLHRPPLLISSHLQSCRDATEATSNPNTSTTPP